MKSNEDLWPRLKPFIFIRDFQINDNEFHFVKNGIFLSPIEFSEKKGPLATPLCIVSYAMLSLNKVGTVFSSCLSVSFVGLLLFRTRLQNRLNKLSLYSVCMYVVASYCKPKL